MYNFPRFLIDHVYSHRQSIESPGLYVKQRNSAIVHVFVCVRRVTDIKAYVIVSSHIEPLHEFSIGIVIILSLLYDMSCVFYLAL